MTWAQGRDTVQGLLDQAELDRVPPSKELADRYLTEAARHLAAAEAIADIDPTGAYQLAYDCARKAAASLLAIQGLRATTRGGHIAVQDTINAQFPIPAFRAFNRLRRRRAQTEYPDLDTPTVTTEDAEHAIAQARDILDAARTIHDNTDLTPFT